MTLWALTMTLGPGGLAVWPGCFLGGCLISPFVTPSDPCNSEQCRKVGGRGTGRYCQADVDSSTSLRMTVDSPEIRVASPGMTIYYALLRRQLFGHALGKTLQLSQLSGNRTR